MEANRARWPWRAVLVVALLVVVVLVRRRAWWGQLLFWAAVFSFGWTGMYLWATRRRR
ncbi:MAG: hypothetical protein HY217_02025 [Candidatus Rokubacteria bacterium]|nr:hypothetical protein [Candidatus Rokubacteria bacterium]